VALAVAVIAAAATHLPVCDALFGCGCRWFFLGGSAHCNIHHAAPPHCPICADRVLGMSFTVGLNVAWFALVRLGQRLLPR